MSSTVYYKDTISQNWLLSNPFQYFLIVMELQILKHIDAANETALFMTALLFVTGFWKITHMGANDTVNI